MLMMNIIYESIKFNDVWDKRILTMNCEKRASAMTWSFRLLIQSTNMRWNSSMDWQKLPHVQKCISHLQSLPTLGPQRNEGTTFSYDIYKDDRYNKKGRRHIQDKRWQTSQSSLKKYRKEKEWSVER